MTRELALLSNPVAGGGRNDAKVAAVAARLRQAGFAVRELVGVDAAHSSQLARVAVADGVDGLVVCGGDGMVNIAAQVLAGSSTPLGIVPMGTGNDTARALGLPLRDPAAAADVIVRGRTRLIDLARSGDRYFVTVLAAGFDAAVNEKANTMTWPKGQLKYSLAIVAVLKEFKPISYTLELDGETRRVEGMLVSVGNGDSMGGGLRVTHGASLDDGLLDVVLFTSVPRRELIKTYPKLFSGGHTRHPAYERHRVKRVTVAASGVVAYADGERFGELPLTVEVVPGALTVFG
ncbi:diacylglycerol kinase (ATP) [Nocardioides terrae]|uniref:Diacylglycerol kinase (ATP) n=1 Tax=Nocardioides terrae TaxID=574651 RepID=A0A1I1JHV3_9ACTN|nr:YegS/Rv2252/BmrU family lipid kinase [Nocardioides terrae]SFC47751.1 diacylglycerol kinase (ATP) [Nocardioides terrae]